MKISKRATIQWSIVTTLGAGIIAGVFATAHADNTHRAVGSYYVAVNGSDQNPGTKSRPFATLQKAEDAALPGSTIYVRAGVYHQTVTVHTVGNTKTGYLTIESYPGEQAVLDGTGIGTPDGGLLTIQDCSYVHIKGLEFRNFKTDKPDLTPMGIYITGSDSHIIIEDNHIHDIATYAPKADGGGNAHGIGVYGNEHKSISDLVIRHNTLDHLRLGASESLALNGNVDGFSVTDNTIHDNNNIGIDVIGFEGVAPFAKLDQARNGVISGNTVYNISSYNNPAYGTEYSADGIYVDGGTQTLIENNRVYNNDYGLELACETKGGYTSFVTATNNDIYDNRAAGIAIGGYDEERGYTANCKILHNTIYNNDTLDEGFGQITFSFDTRNNLIRDNIIDAVNKVTILSNPFDQNTGNLVDWNVYYTSVGAAKAAFEWKTEGFTGFQNYQAGSGNDKHSLFAAPIFKDAAHGDFHQQKGSRAHGYGSNF